MGIQMIDDLWCGLRSPQAWADAHTQFKSKLGKQREDMAAGIDPNLKHLHSSDNNIITLCNIGNRTHLFFQSCLLKEQLHSLKATSSSLKEWSHKYMVLFVKKHGPVC